MLVYMLSRQVGEWCILPTTVIPVLAKNFIINNTGFVGLLV